MRGRRACYLWTPRGTNHLLNSRSRHLVETSWGIRGSVRRWSTPMSSTGAGGVWRARLIGYELFSGKHPLGTDDPAGPRVVT